MEASRCVYDGKDPPAAGLRACCSLWPATAGNCASISEEEQAG